MATNERDLTLEARLNSATNPAKHEEDWEAITQFCDQVNSELEGPQYAVRLLAHKCQSPMETEAMYALSTLDACVKSCGKRFHQEIGKFRFLNEMIKVISPKYLGNKTPEKVKKRSIELLYCWQKGLPHEPKVKDAYKMLKHQGLVKEDPTYMDKVSDDIPKPTQEEDKKAAFEDEEKSKLLAKLLKSKNPDDLQAANRLIKNMVKQDSERMEKVSRRINELETIHRNLKLLAEMVGQFNPQTTTQSEKEMMKELYESLEKLRPKLFRLASETEEADTEGLNVILKANDEVSAVMSDYKKTVEGLQENGQDSQKDEELIGLKSPGQAVGGDTNDNLLSELDDLFSSANVQQVTAAPTNQPSVSMANPGVFTQPMYGAGQPMMGGNQGLNQPMGNNQMVSQPITSNPALHQPITDVFSSNTFSSSVSPQIMPGMNQGVIAPPLGSNQLPQGKAMEDLDVLGKNLMQQTLGDAPPKYSFNQGPKPVPAKVTLNQMAGNPNASSASINSVPVIPAVSMVTHPPPVSAVSGSLSTTITSPTTTKSSEVLQPLTDIFVPLESIQPSSNTPVNAYDKNGLKIVIHTAKDRPREDVLVMVVSVVSTNTVPVKGFVFQAAVPKIMKVKLQPPSATDLPAYNPILPPAAITQVMLLANPQKEKIRLKYKVMYALNEQNISDVGDIDSFTVQ